MKCYGDLGFIIVLHTTRILQGFARRFLDGSSSGRLADLRMTQIISRPFESIDHVMIHGDEGLLFNAFNHPLRRDWDGHLCSDSFPHLGSRGTWHNSHLDDVRIIAQTLSQFAPVILMISRINGSQLGSHKVNGLPEFRALSSPCLVVRLQPNSRSQSTMNVSGERAERGIKFPTVSDSNIGRKSLLTFESSLVVELGLIVNGEELPTLRVCCPPISCSLGPYSV